MIWTTARYLTPYPYSGESLVEGTDENGNTETVRRDTRPFRMDDEGIFAYLAAGKVIADFRIDPATNITSAPKTLFGGPTLKEIFDGN